MDKRTIVLRIDLILLASYALAVGAIAMFAPRLFYDSFPFFDQWVSALPPYNEHLVRDIGGLYLAIAVICAWAAYALAPNLVGAACAGSLLVGVTHLWFHATHVQGVGTGAAALEVALLATLVLLPLLALWALISSARKETTTEGAHHG
jgi:hypothetical protein